MAGWQKPPRNNPRGGAHLLDPSAGNKLTPAGVEVTSLLDRYRVLSPREVTRLRTLSSSLSINDVEAIARSETLSHAMFDFYQEYGSDLRLPRRQFVRLMTTCLILAGVVLAVAHLA